VRYKASDPDSVASFVECSAGGPNALSHCITRNYRSRCAGLLSGKIPTTGAPNAPASASTLVNGNYEFASLITIEDDEWWTSFGGQLIANWESEGIRIYSSLDTEGISQLVNDGRWTDEGIFAFLQGIQRLAQMGRQRVNLPPTELEYRQ
jgi:hypothetical protein